MPRRCLHHPLQTGQVRTDASYIPNYPRGSLSRVHFDVISQADLDAAHAHIQQMQKENTQLQLDVQGGTVSTVSSIIPSQAFEQQHQEMGMQMASLEEAIQREGAERQANAAPHMWLPT
eukprot:6180597-Pleurochrysis_carterae.AAC.1